LLTLLPRLREAQAAEYAALWYADYEGLKVERDALAAQLREVYPPYATKIADLFARIAVNDAALSRLHQTRPAVAISRPVEFKADRSALVRGRRRLSTCGLSRQAEEFLATG
jgi:hypothetical protein